MSAVARWKGTRTSPPAGVTTLHMWISCTECKQEYKVNGMKFTGPTMFYSRKMHWLKCFDCWLKRHPTPVSMVEAAHIRVLVAQRQEARR